MRLDRLGQRWRPLRNPLPPAQGWTLREAAHHSNSGGRSRARNEGCRPHPRQDVRSTLLLILNLLMSNFRPLTFVLGPCQIPSTAVEMPGSADIPGLNLQFGALDFGSETALTEFGVADNCVNAASRESTPAPTSAPPSMGAGTQSQTSLYSKPLRYRFV